jgi:hypothetical protein
VAVTLIECVGARGMQGGGGQEYAHTLDHPLNYSVLFKILQTIHLCNNIGQGNGKI